MASLTAFLVMARSADRQKTIIYRNNRARGYADAIACAARDLVQPQHAVETGNR